MSWPRAAAAAAAAVTTRTAACFIAQTVWLATVVAYCFVRSLSPDDSPRQISNNKKFGISLHAADFTPIGTK